MTTVQKSQLYLPPKRPSTNKSSRDLIKVQQYPITLIEQQKQNEYPAYLKGKPIKQFGHSNKNRPFSSSSSNQEKRTDQQSIQIDSYYNQQYFKGKILTPWLFFVNQSGIYDKLVTYLDNLIPYARTSQQLNKYFIAENAYYNVVVDIVSVQQLLLRDDNDNITQKIKEIHIYNNSAQNDNKRTQSTIHKVKKKFGLRFKSVIVSIESFLKQLKDRIQKHQSFINRVQLNLMSSQTHDCDDTLFVNLSEQNPNVEKIKFRQNLLKGVNMSIQCFQGDNSILPSQYFIDSFNTFTKRFYFNDENTLAQIQNYFSQINPSNFSPQKQDQMRQILLFNHRESFFERFTTNMSRIYKKVPQQKAVIFPFAKHYSAIKYFYEKFINQKEKDSSLVQVKEVYCLMRVKDVGKLKQGEIIQNVGFMYCSKDRLQVESKVRNRNDTVMMTIKLPFMVGMIKSIDNESNKVYNHGYVDYSSMMCSQISKQQSNYVLTQEQQIKKDNISHQQVVINAFNLFKVTKHISKTIQVQYTTLDQLLINPHVDQQHNLSSQISKSTINNNLKALKQQLTYNYDIADFYHFIGDKQQQIQQRKRLLLTNKNSQTNLIKIIQIIENTQNNNQLESQSILKQISTNLLKSNEKEFRDKSQLRRLIKCVLLKNQDKVNVQNILNKQITLLKQGVKKAQINSSERETLLIQYAQTLNQSGSNLMEMGKYSQAQRMFKQSIEMIEDELNLQNKNKNQNISSLCCSWFKNIFSRHQNVKVQNTFDEQSVRKQNLNKLRRFFRQFINAIMSLLKTYKIMKYNNAQQMRQYIEKGHKYIQMMSNNNNNNNKEYSMQKKQLTDIEMLQMKFKVQSNGGMLTKNENYNNNNNQLKSYDSILHIIKEKQTKTKKNQKSSLQHIEFYDTLLQWKQKLLNQLLTHTIYKQKESLAQQRNNQQLQMVSQSHIMQMGRQKQTNNNQSSQLQQHQQLLQEIIDHYKTLIDIKLLHFSQNSPQVFKTKNDLAQLLIQNKYSPQAKSIINTLIKCPLAQQHSQGSKAQYLLAIISFQHGHYKHSFERLNKAFNILKQVTLKQNQKEYQQVLKKQPIFRRIQLLRARIYNEQQRYELSLRSLQFLESVPCDTQDYIKIIRMKGQTIALRKGPGDQKRFMSEYEKVVQIFGKSKEVKRINIQQGIIYCSIAKCLIKYQKLEQAKKYLKKSQQVFNNFSSNNPNLWVYYFTKSILLMKQSQSLSQMKPLVYFKGIKDSMQLVQKALQGCNKKYGQRSITYLKLKMHHVKLMKIYYQCKINDNDCSKQEYEQNVNETYQQIRTILIQIDNQVPKSTNYQLKVDSQAQLLLKIIQIQLTPSELLVKKDQLQKDCVNNLQEQSQQRSQQRSQSNNQNNNNNDQNNNGSDQTQGLSSQTGQKLIMNNNNNCRYQSNSQIISQSSNNESNHIISKRLFAQQSQLKQQKKVQEQ